MPAFAFRCSSPPTPAQIETAAAVGAPVIEIHTGAWCEAVIDGQTARRRAEFERIARGAALAKSSASRSMPAMASICTRPRPSRRLPEIVELNIGHFLIGEAIFGGLAESVQTDARRDGSRPARSRRPAHDHRHRLGHHRHPPHREGDRAAWRPLHRPHLHRRGAGQGGTRARIASRPTPSASPPRRPAPRRSAPGLRAGVWWRDMGVVNLPSGRPTMKLTGGAKRAARGVTPRGPRGAHRPDHHRRISAWPRHS